MHPYDPPTDPWLSVIHQDRDLLVVDKPSGLLSIPGRDPSLQDSALTRALRDHPHAWAVHRLDRDTSGVLILALRRAAERHLQAQFADRTVQKRYRARVWGQPPPEGVIDLPIARIGGNPPINAVDHENGLPAHTRFRVVRRGPDTADVDLFPTTGRSHQLRVHLCAIGHPIVGDPIYGPLTLPAAPRLLLHAHWLRCKHPYSEVALELEAALPPELTL